MSEENMGQLLIGLSERDSEASFKAIYMEFYPKLMVFSKVYVKQQDIAEDLVEDVFIKLWNNRRNITAIKNLKFYLFVSAKNACLSYLVKNNKIYLQSLEDFDLEIGGLTISPEDNMISKEKLSIIRNAIQNLPPKCKAIFILIKEDGLKYTEVAELLDISVKTVEAQMSIALKKLSEAMKYDFPEFISKASQKV